MSNLPTVPELIDQLRMYKRKAALSNAQVATAMATFGWGTSHWSTVHIDSLFAGRTKFTEVEVEFVELFLLNRFYTYNIT